MAVGPLVNPPPIDTQALSPARTMASAVLAPSTSSGPYKHSVIPDHSSLPSPLSPPLSVSPPSVGSMADLIAAMPSVPGPSIAALPPIYPSSSPSSSSSSSSSSAPATAPAALFIQPSPEAWLAHAKEQRRHFSSASLSSTTSSIAFSPDTVTARSPLPLEFGESEQIHDDSHLLAAHAPDREPDQEDDQDQELDVNLRPSELRKSLMARAKRSSAKMRKTKRSESMPLSMSVDSGSRLSMISNQSNNSISSAYDSRFSACSSTSSFSAWTNRARSASVSSHASNDSVNLDALIAEGSDINEECLLQLEDDDDVEWTKEQQRSTLLQDEQKPVPRRRNTTAGTEMDLRQFDGHTTDDLWDSEALATEEDEGVNQIAQETTHQAVQDSIKRISGLSLSGDMRTASAKSSRFADGRNPYDLEADFMDSSAGLRSADRSSSASDYSTTSSNRSSISRLPSSGMSRLPGASGLKAPSSRLTQPASRSMLTQPKAGSSTTIAKPSAGRATGLQAPKAGSQPTKSGIQAPRSGLQPPRAASSSSLTARGSTAARPGASGIVAPSRAGATSAGSSRLPSSAARPGVKSSIAPPGSLKKPSVTTGRQSLLPPARSASAIPSGRTVTSPSRTMTSPNLITSPTRGSSHRPPSTYLISPTSSHSSSTSLPSMTMSANKDAAVALSRRLSNATGTTQLGRPRSFAPNGRAVSMYGVSSFAHDYHEEDYLVPTPPHSPPSSKAGTRATTGIPRSGIVPPSRLMAPSVSTARTGRAISPSPMISGSNSNGHVSMLPRSHTPTSSRIPSGLVSPRAGRH